MTKISLRKIEESDNNYFLKWWRDSGLIDLTSGNHEYASDNQLLEYFIDMINSKNDYHYIIELDKIVAGHISLSKRQDNWYELQIVIGEKDKWGMGYGSDAINMIMNLAKQSSITKTYLEVRPTNTRAIRSYEKCGFNVIKTIQNPDNPNLPETLRMELSLV